MDIEIQCPITHSNGRIDNLERGTSFATRCSVVFAYSST
jgi:hypothetical protein